MRFEDLAEDLRTWLRQSYDAGNASEALVQSMRASGYQAQFASAAVELAYRRFGAPAPAPVQALAPAADAGSASPPDLPTDSSRILAGSPNTIRTSDREVHILLALNAPRVVLFGNLLSPEECDEMIRLSRGKLERSSVVNAATGAYDVHPDRTSQGTHFQRGENPLVARIERRIAELISYPVERGEPIQVLNYGPGAQYRPHFDYFDPALPGNEKVLQMGGQRIATLVMYLNDVDAGGSTVFPDIGLDVLPRRGNAVYFAYAADAGDLDARTLHGGSPVAAGEKWIATKWLRQRDYVGPSA
ncbi:MAG TPA: 2OG-Fe(II) oxygenase [Burkholderiaceae bacterium]|nr:2OG-Fe(II) oxygenase [Burkholderiaceae bacterium]